MTPSGMEPATFRLVAQFRYITSIRIWDICGIIFDRESKIIRELVSLPILSSQIPQGLSLNLRSDVKASGRLHVIIEVVRRA